MLEYKYNNITFSICLGHRYALGKVKAIDYVTYSGTVPQVGR